ncbi:MAG: zinc ribbon domain-containing protein [Promethearchaeota archaeon]|jgi:hypothetical protein
MKLIIRKRYSFMILGFIFIPSLYLILLFPDLNYNYNESSNLRLSQTQNNFSIESKFQALIWIEARLVLKIESNQSGVIWFDFTDASDGRYFGKINKSIEILGTNKTQTIKLVLKPRLMTLPGKYNFTLNVGGLYDYSERYEAIMGMGYIILIAVLVIFIIGIIIILRKNDGYKKIKVIPRTQVDSISASLEEISENKIKCPECKKLIDEGLTFCPDCGSRIPEFLRFNPNSTRGL